MRRGYGHATRVNPDGVQQRGWSWQRPNTAESHMSHVLFLGNPFFLFLLKKISFFYFSWDCAQPTPVDKL